MDSSKSTKADPNAGAAADTGASADTGRRRSGAEELADTTPLPTLNQVRYPCLMNMDYHAAREAWLDRLHRWLMFAVIVAGGAALIDMWPAMRLWGPVIAVIAGALDLTFDLSNRARAHAMFRRRYAEILGKASRSPDQLGALQCKIDELGGEEEPPFGALMALSAMKAQQATYGRIVDPCRPKLFYRLFANIMRFDGHDFNEPDIACGT